MLFVPSALLLLLAAANGSTATFQIDVEGLRGSRGLIQACITRDPGHFPDCRGDPLAVTQTMPAASRQMRFVGLSPGRYAVSLLHDANANARLDMLFGIPREGIGFSRNPAFRFGAPPFDAVDIDLSAGFTRTTIRMRYLL